MTTPIITRGAAAAAAPPPAHEAARQLESFFLRQFLTEARPASGMLDGGFAGDTFRDMLDSALADSMSAAGGLGLTATFETALGGEPAPGRAVAAPAAGAALAAAIPISRPALAAAIPPRPAPAGGLAAPIELAGHGAMMPPASGRFSSRFGVRVDPIDHTRKGHAGLDIAARTGTPVVAALGGTVERAGPAGTYGNLVVVRHPDGSETRYAHLSAISVKVGDQVAIGAPLGAVGTTGRSTGPHLHFEVRRNGRPVDPWPLLMDDETAPPP